MQPAVPVYYKYLIDLLNLEQVNHQCSSVPGREGKHKSTPLPFAASKGVAYVGTQWRQGALTCRKPEEDVHLLLLIQDSLIPLASKMLLRGLHNINS